jgi:peptidoglycan hydrolase-like protein with peptidoglycan-binding domain
MNIKKIASIAIAGVMILGPVVASAQTVSTTSNTQVQTMLSQIQTLQAQIQALKNAQALVASTTASISSTLLQMRNLKQGMSGEDVKALQAILASDPSIYSGDITGFFGKNTAEALKKYQKKNGLDGVGFVGPKTLKKLMEHMNELGISSEHGNATSTEKRKEGENRDKELCVKVPPGQLIAPGQQKRDGDDRKGGDDRNEKRGEMRPISSILPPCKDLPKGIDDKINGENHGTVTPRDTTAPTISSVSTSNLLATTTNIVWATNENSNSRVWFGTINPVNYKTDPNIRTGDLFVTNHVIPLTGLSTSTTYYYVVGSIDPFGNSATSSQGSFTTLAQ